MISYEALSRIISLLYNKFNIYSIFPYKMILNAIFHLSLAKNSQTFPGKGWVDISSTLSLVTSTSFSKQRNVGDAILTYCSSFIETIAGFMDTTQKYEINCFFTTEYCATQRMLKLYSKQWISSSTLVHSLTIRRPTYHELIYQIGRCRTGVMDHSGFPGIIFVRII